MQNQSLLLGMFSKRKKPKRKKISFFDSAYLTAKSTNYARYQGESLLVEIWRFPLNEKIIFSPVPGI